MIFAGDIVDWFDRLLRSIKIKLLSNRGTLCLVDRWSIDKLVNFKIQTRTSRFSSLYYNFLYFLYIKLIFKPDLIIYLKINGQTSFERKAEHSIQIQERRSHVLDSILGDSFDSDSILIISGNTDIEKIDSNITRQIFSSISIKQEVKN
jgi:thymidylate kinase